MYAYTIRVHVCKYVLIYVCMYVCMCVCMCVRMRMYAFLECICKHVYKLAYYVLNISRS